MFGLRKKMAISGVTALIAAAFIVSSNEASAATLKFTSDGPTPPGVNDCSGDFGSPPNCVYESQDDYYFSGPGAGAAAAYTTNNYGTLNQIAKIDDPFDATPVVSAGSILGAGTFAFEVIGSDLKWTYNPNGSLAAVFAFSIKGGNKYNVWEFDTAPTASGGSQMFTGWFSPQGNSTSDISHITFFGKEIAAIPLPAGGLLLITALGGLGMASRRLRKAS
jgi:hypothetical protein